MDIAEKVKEIISQQLDVDLAEVKEPASFIDDLGADSLAIVELVLAFEEHFGDHLAWISWAALKPRI